MLFYLIYNTSAKFNIVDSEDVYLWSWRKPHLSIFLRILGWSGCQRCFYDISDLVPGLLGIAIRKSSSIRSSCLTVSLCSRGQDSSLSTDVSRRTSYVGGYGEYWVCCSLLCSCVLYLAGLLCLGFPVHAGLWIVYVYGSLRASRTIHKRLVESILGSTFRCKS